MLLYGVNCTKHIWDYINPYLKNFEIDYVEYPHDVTLNAKKVMISHNGFIKTMDTIVTMQLLAIVLEE